MPLSRRSPLSETDSSQRTRSQRIIQKLLCRKDPPHIRAVQIGRPSLLKYPSNKVKNTKYNLFTFFPKLLFYQFRFFLSFIYLVMACTQFIPALKVGFLYAYWAPLGFVTFVTMAREGYDDCSRYVRDKALNARRYSTLSPEGWVMKKSSKLVVGDVIVINKDERVPADCVLLQTQEKAGTCFIRTDQLDGETDWKLRVAVTDTQLMEKIEGISKAEAEILAKQPTKDIHSFEGTYQHGLTSESLNLESTLWANTIVASGPVTAVVLYTGKETRAAKNESEPRTKIGKVDTELNDRVKLLFCVCFLLAGIMILFKGIHWDSHIAFIRFVLLFSYIIPLCLRVHLDIAKLVYAIIIRSDKEIPGNIVRSTTIPEELGRVGYLMTDKTGTLTLNQMVMKRFHLGTVCYAPDTNSEVQELLAKGLAARTNNLSTSSFIGNNEADAAWNSKGVRVTKAVEAVALCHNVTPVTTDGEVCYHAASPDEVALVTWCAEVGLTLVDRDRKNVTLKSQDGSLLKYEILQLFPFSSDTKRMGIITKDNATNQITLFVKGADTVMQKMVQHNDWLVEECTNLAREGLRTLVVASKDLTQAQYDEFAENYEIARTALADRAAKTSAVLAKLEFDLRLLCLTGVEDMLQPDVRVTLELLLNAGMRIWMLTGDKLETAICIAKASRLILRTHTLHVIREVQSRSEVGEQLQALARKSNVALVITGDSLQVCLKLFAQEFAILACSCATVVCCRVSPEQKTTIVRMLMKSQPKKRIAAVGDGGNDVGMIQVAHVGIGIVGKEGQQASLAADFSINQFSHVQRLFLVHGRYTYKRTCTIAHFIFHRGLIVTFIQALFSLMFYFVSVSVFQGMMLVAYVTVLTGFPIFAMAMDQDVSPQVCLQFPELYRDIEKGRSLSYKNFFTWFLAAMWSGMAIMYGTYAANDYDLMNVVTMSFTALIITELVMVILFVRTWHWTMVVAESASVLIYGVAIFCAKGYLDQELVRTSKFWYKVALITGVSCIPLFMARFLQYIFAKPVSAKLS